MSGPSTAHPQPGYFETLRTHGGRPALLGAHLDRLKLTGIEFDAEDARGRVERQLDRIDHDVVIRLEADGHGVSVTLRELPEHASVDPARPVDAILCAVPGYAYPHKSTERKLHSDLIAQADAAGAFEAIVHDADLVIEGARTNVFALQGDRLISTPLGRCLPGVTRAAVAQLAAQLGLRFVTAPVTTYELLEADEVLLTNALIGVRRVGRVDADAIGGRAPDVQRALHAALLAHYEAADD